MKQIKFPPDGVEKTKCPNAVHLGGVLGKVERHLGVRVYMLENIFKHLVTLSIPKVARNGQKLPIFAN